MSLLTPRLKKILLAVFILPLVVLIWAAIIISGSGVWHSRSAHICALCRATRTHETWLQIPVINFVSNNNFSNYYFKEVDPNHVHVWKFISCYNHGLRGGEIGCGRPCGNPPLRLRDKPALAILRSFTNPQLRKAFLVKLSTYGEKSQRELTLMNATDALNEAYDENPKRRDWQQLIQKLDLAP